MGWVALWIVVTVVGAIGTIASLNSLRFGHRVTRDVRLLASWRSGTPAGAVTAPVALPPPVQRYLVKAVTNQSRPIQEARLRHGGVFRPSLDGSWLPIRGEEYFHADPPGFVWWGRVRLAPGIWIDARDRSVGGVGNMLVTFESTVTLANSSGPQLDQGALLRLLGELAWLPTVFFDHRYIRWAPVDNRRASATLSVNAHTVSGEFTFGPDDLPATFSANRYRDTGGGTSVLTPFVGRVSDFRRVDGVLVPYRVVGAWIVDGQESEYVNFEVQQLEYDWAGAR